MSYLFVSVRNRTIWRSNISVKRTKRSTRAELAAQVCESRALQNASGVGEHTTEEGREFHLFTILLPMKDRNRAEEVGWTQSLKGCPRNLPMDCELRKIEEGVMSTNPLIILKVQIKSIRERRNSRDSRLNSNKRPR